MSWQWVNAGYPLFKEDLYGIKIELLLSLIAYTRVFRLALYYSGELKTLYEQKEILVHTSFLITIQNTR